MEGDGTEPEVSAGLGGAALSGGRRLSRAWDICILLSFFFFFFFFLYLFDGSEVICE